MVLNGKPYKSFITMNDIVVSEGNNIQFSTTDGTVIEGLVMKIANKGMTIYKEGALNSENWSFVDIEEGTLTVV